MVFKHAHFYLTFQKLLHVGMCARLHVYVCVHTCVRVCLCVWQEGRQEFTSHINCDILRAATM